MKFILMFILVIVAFSNFAATEFLDERIPTIEKSLKTSPLETRALVCPSGTYECNDSEGGCCSTGTTCLPNFKCSGSGNHSGGIILKTSPTISQILSIVLAYLYLI
ncbi:uncharacterized protein OCT59_016255 [Rhizophagus irregularis]|uniref:Uncharacterized protein n=3 Tax=Rhizophagus irregularis TaxID=588596 RepID=A0A015IVC3_RHIIW|nr:hypothetical protein GLOIN_2v1710859 [Rhizophagus irregularis DAOM 181602=DAOM 197198]EXX58205.1 hypothetical protein RirG_200110 [Rhizophagus irregularis DAOM 197198w]POG60693.1 hypothetical protein GLOIN_2v1710859 [Rhizophagus irregularis DAOM 181602=DAOM 197198]UZO23926.1 hypothetical protein OCT59_016255 [Rhizophagus irregularis]GBC31263.1 hypothetical protein GLOIN_2v1710859 [Rhizophagus irregularis DAOM 181602=DAOM 197198]|eukprot:XP_025167559.1 hypothetical protein GLOIN_2v1710859 [Rhizophagus irregularis DAOM 181602=DAOM 197198]